MEFPPGLIGNRVYSCETLEWKPTRELTRSLGNNEPTASLLPVRFVRPVFAVVMCRVLIIVRKRRQSTVGVCLGSPGTHKTKTPPPPYLSRLDSLFIPHLVFLYSCQHPSVLCCHLSSFHTFLLPPTHLETFICGEYFPYFMPCQPQV